MATHRRPGRPRTRGPASENPRHRRQLSEDDYAGTWEAWDDSSVLVPFGPQPDAPDDVRRDNETHTDSNAGGAG